MVENKPSYLWVCDQCREKDWETLTIGRLIDDRVCKWCGRGGVNTSAVSFDKLIGTHAMNYISKRNDIGGGSCGEEEKREGNKAG